MSEKRAEEALASFVATLPKYLRLYLERGEWDQEDWQAYADADYRRDRALIEEYERLLQSCPTKRRDYLKRKRAVLDSLLPRTRRGRPRKDADVDEAIKLKSMGKSWGQIGTDQGKSGDAVRKLTKSREKPPGK
jgi:hypothetical protein